MVSPYFFLKKVMTFFVIVTIPIPSPPSKWSFV